MTSQGLLCVLSGPEAVSAVLARLAPPPHEAGHDCDQGEEEGDGDAAHRPLGGLPLRPRQDRPQLRTELDVEEAAVLLRHIQACRL